MSTNHLDISAIRAATFDRTLAGFVTAAGGVDIRRAATAKVSKPDTIRPRRASASKVSKRGTIFR